MLGESSSIGRSNFKIWIGDVLSDEILDWESCEGWSPDYIYMWH